MIELAGILKGTQKTVAQGGDECRRRAGELAGADFLTKPIDFDALKASLRQLPSTAN